MSERPADDGPLVVLVSDDLLARARVESAVRGADARLRVVPADTSLAGIADLAPALVLVDLDARSDDAVGPIGRKGHVPVLAFFSHVHPEAAATARSGGWQALPRGRFWRELPELVAAALV
ncbi:MAG: hypothetical protein ABR575_04305 [Actinomycetota bacterium]